MTRRMATSMGALAALSEGMRQRLFDFIRGAHRPVSREEAAAGLGISRKLAAFHLDKLVESGLLRARYESPPGAARRVGRTPKVYEADDVEIQITIPQREYALLADILIDAVLAENKDERAGQAALRMALQRGRDLGAATRAAGEEGRGDADLDIAEGALRRNGFEPYRQGSASLRLRNCPFHPLSKRAPQLVCAMNHAYLAGLLSGMGAESVQAFLEPRAGECCVEVRKAAGPD